MSAALHVVVPGQRELNEAQRAAVAREWTRVFLRRLVPRGYFDLRAISNGGTVTRSVRHDDVDGVLAFAAEHRAQRNVYFGVAARDVENGRTLEDCLGLWAFFADVDFKDTPEAAARAKLASFALAPSAVVASGGGLHAYWFLNEPCYLVNEHGRAQATGILRGLAQAVGGDLSSAEPAHILRLPGTLNLKNPAAPRPVVLEHVDPDGGYAVDELRAALPPIVEPAPRKALPPVQHNLSVDERVRRAAAWLKTQAPAVQGQGGDERTFQVCCGVAVGHDLEEEREEEDALKALAEWNARCQPPWKTWELRLKLHNARNYGHEQRGSRLVDQKNGPVLVSAADFLAATEDQEEWLVPRLAPLGGMVMFHGRPRSMKSLAALAALLAIARGEAPWGVPDFEPERPIRCAYFSEEDGKFVVAARLRWLLAGFKAATPPATLMIEARRGLSLDDEASQRRIRDEITQHGVEFAWFDTARAMAPGVDQGPADAAGAVRFLRSLLAETGLKSIGLTHHDVKPARDGIDTRARSEKASGGALLAAVDCPIGFTRIDDRSTLVVPDRYKVGADPHPVRLEFHSATLPGEQFKEWVTVVARDSDERQERLASIEPDIVRVLEETGDWMTVNKIREAVGKQNSDVGAVLASMLRRGAVEFQEGKRNAKNYRIAAQRELHQ